MSNKTINGIKTTHTANYEQIRDVSKKVKEFHNQLMLRDEFSNKSEALRMLKSSLMKYLSIAPHDFKFRFPETDEILTLSVSQIADFDPVDACEAFENLANYSHNLLDYPWRKDFYRIKLYSGFFLHKISAYLQEADKLLKIMGYIDDDEDEHALILLIKPDPVILQAVSQDCYAASQECLILSLIWQRVQSEVPGYPLTVFEAFQLRKKITGGVEDIAKILISEGLEKAPPPPPVLVPVDRLIDIGDDTTSSSSEKLDNASSSASHQKSVPLELSKLSLEETNEADMQFDESPSILESTFAKSNNTFDDLIKNLSTSIENKTKTEFNKSIDFLTSTPTPSSSTINSWECQHCTFINQNERTICEICRKLRKHNKKVKNPKPKSVQNLRNGKDFDHDFGLDLAAKEAKEDDWTLVQHGKKKPTEENPRKGNGASKGHIHPLPQRNDSSGVQSTLSEVVAGTSKKNKVKPPSQPRQVNEFECNKLSEAGGGEEETSKKSNKIDSSEQQPEQQEEKPQIACPQCTLLNDINKTKCDACHNDLLPDEESLRSGMRRRRNRTKWKPFLPS